VERDPSLEVTVDLERLAVAAPAAGIESSFPLDAFTQHRLLEGLDDIGLTLRYVDDIDAYERRRPDWLPAVTA
jgi:3-isopropylmalate/(R)-2-methylmalate dehydratase small subunit